MTETTSSQAPARGEARRWAAVVICWSLIVMDGYDLIVYGAVQNSLIETTDWGLTPASAGTLGSLAFLGMMIGAVVAGRLADAIGRRRTILLCVIVFGVATVACALAPNPGVFGARASSPASASADSCPRRTRSPPSSFPRAGAARWRP